MTAKWYLTQCAAALAFVVLSVGTAYGDVRSKECPFDCDTENIPRSVCKDWREGSTCFVEDLRNQASAERDESSLEREITSVNRALSAGESREIELHDRPVERVDVVARRTDASATQTKVALSLEDGSALGTAQQLDTETNTVVRFAIDLEDPDGRELQLSAVDGPIYVESVHVLYRR